MSLRPPRALIVDKDSSETADLKSFLAANGIDVAWAKDGEQAFNILDGTSPNGSGESAPHGPEVVITELKAHRVDGMRLLEVAKKRNPWPPQSYPPCSCSRRSGSRSDHFAPLPSPTRLPGRSP